MKTTSSLPFYSAPLAAALEQISFWIQRENSVRIISATASLKELEKEQLPKHVTIEKRPLKGRRIAVRRTSHFRQTRLRIARYPESQMDELAVPILLCVIKGAAKIYAGDYVLTCHPGDFVLIPAMTPKGNYLSHAIDHQDPKSSCHILYFYPGRLLGDGLELWISNSKGTKLDSSAQLGATLLKNYFLAALFTQLCKEIQCSSKGEITFLLVKSLISFLLRELQEERAILPDIKRLNLPAENDRDPIRYALTYMESNLGNHLTIEEMARETALSPTNFKQLFRQHTGVPFHQYLTNLRLQLAKTLLNETDLKVQEVAERIGLSPSRLNRHFHAKFSCSPGQFRKKK